MTTTQQRIGLFEVAVPEGEKLTFWVKENDGTHAEVEVQDLIPALLQLGSEHTAPSEADQDQADEDSVDISNEAGTEEVGDESDFGYFVVPDGTVFTRDGKAIDVEEAMGYLEQGIVESLHFAVSRPSETSRTIAESLLRDLVATTPVVSAGIWGFHCALCGAETGEGDPGSPLEEHEAHRLSEEWHRPGCVWVRAKRHLSH